MTAPNISFPQADSIIEQLRTEIHQLIGTEYRDAAIDAASRAEAAAEATASHRSHVDDQAEAIDTAFTESIPPYLQTDAPGGLRTFVRSEMRSMGPGTLTDHTQEIQSNLDAIAAGGGGVLLLLPGTYKITAMLKMPPKVSLRGSGEFATHINAASLPAGSTAIQMTPGSTATSLSDMSMTGSANRNSNGLHIGRLPTDAGGSVADFIVSNVRFDTFGMGITGAFAWCGKIVNTRIHSCLTGLQLGPQVNAISFNGWLSSFVEHAAVLTNAENVTFDTASIESEVSTQFAINLFRRDGH